MLAFQGADGKAKTVSPADPLPVTGLAGGGGGGTGDASAAKQDQQTAQLTAINADLGAPDAAPAESPTATAGIGPLLKLGLQGLATALTNWTTLLSRVPALTVTSNRLQVSTGQDQALTDAQLRAAAVAVQTTAAPTDPTGNGTRQYDWANSQRTAVGSTSTAAVALPALPASREVMFHASSRCFVRMGDSAVGAATVAAGQMVLEAGERFHIRIPTGTTHYRVIRDTADGFLNVAAVL